MKIAVEGCAHGELEKIYETLEYIQQEQGITVDLLLCCGDFQSVRNKSDLSCMAVPKKYQTMSTFYKYYSGEKMAPILTVFIGGNHEASNYLGELAYGGWVCPNIYYLGYAGVVTFGGVRIAGISGIFKGHDFLRGHFEAPPYNDNSKRSVYHIRNIDVFRLKQIRQPLHVFLSHDWPRGVYHHGDVNALLRRKPFLREDIERECLGSSPTRDLLEKLRPEFWFAAHLHVKFSALVRHPQADGSKAETERQVTKFLALDKCLPRRDFLQVLDIGSELDHSDGNLSLCYDEEWLCILKSTNHLLSINSTTQYLPSSGCTERWDFRPTEAELEEVRNLFKQDFRIPQNFIRTAEPYDPKLQTPRCPLPPKLQINPQTTELCSKLGIDDPFKLLMNKLCRRTDSLTINSFRSSNTTNVSLNSSLNPDEVILDSDGDGDDDDDAGFSDMPSTDVSSILNVTSDDVNEASSSKLDVVVEAITPKSSGRTKLNLPPVSHFASTSTPVVERGSVKFDRKLKNDPLLASPIAESTENRSENSDRKVDDQTTIPLHKKFKRRNEAIYAFNASDEND